MPFYENEHRLRDGAILVYKRMRLKARSSTAKFVIDAENLKYGSLQLLLRIYGFWLKYDGDTDRTARAYYDWATALNTRIARRNKEIVEHNKRVAQRNKERRSLGKEAKEKELKLWRRGVWETGWDEKKNAVPYALRRMQIWRYIKKARLIAANVARGHFPGKFSS